MPRLAWYRKAANSGYTESEISVGRFYMLGRGVAEDNAEGMRWMLRAAQQGDANAQGIVGSVYQHGKYATLDYAAALKWLTLGARGGNNKAQYDLGWTYLMGTGVSRDLRRGCAWLVVSAANGYALAKTSLAEGRTGVSFDQRKQAERAAAAWQPGSDVVLADEPPGYVGLSAFNLNAPFLPGY